MSDHPHQAKSQRRIYRAVSCWAAVSAIVAAGGKPDLDDIIFLLCLGESVPSDVQAHLADRLAARPKGKGRPSKHPGQLEYDQFMEARALFDAVHKIRTEGREGRRPLSRARACAIYAETNKLNAESVERRYRVAKKKLLSRIERDGTGAPRYFLTAEDYISWEKTNLKNKADK